MRFVFFLDIFFLELACLFEAPLSFQAFHLLRRSAHLSGPRKFSFGRLDIKLFAVGRSFSVGDNNCRRYLLLDELDLFFGTFSFDERS